MLLTGMVILPGTGNPILANLIKYFCTLLATCRGVRVPKALDILLNR